MAIYHLSAQVISSSQGRSAVRAAAYRHGAKMYSAAVETEVSYASRDHVAHSELSIPEKTPEWLRSLIDGRDTIGASEALWNAVEKKEGIKGTGLAMEMNIALPIELTLEQNIALTRAWVQENITSKGFVADWAVHDNPGNPHFHVMIPMRRLAENGFGPKHEVLRDLNGQVIRREDGKPRYQLYSPPQYELPSWRQSWAEIANRHLAEAGIEAKIDHRSFKDQGIELAPTGHLGVVATSMEAKGKDSDRVLEETKKRKENAIRIMENPDEILKLITRERSVFNQKDIAKTVFRYIDDPQDFQNVIARVNTLNQMVLIQSEIKDDKNNILQEARWTTNEMLQVEFNLQQSAARLWTDSSHKVDKNYVEKAFESRSFLAEEQREAVRHVTGKDRIAAVVGFAGAGKSTMLAAANEAWVASGHKVHGAALAGKAAEGLEKSSNIASRTLASWELAWSNEKDRLAAGDIFVIDEAGMVSSKQLSRVLQEIEQRGAKAVLVGDAMQLQPIEAGAAFRAVTDIVGYAELSGVRRQKHDWMRDASVNFARGAVDKALEAYRNADMVQLYANREIAKSDLIQTWKTDFLAVKENGKPSETLILAHTNKDVFELNHLARNVLKNEGRLEGESLYMTARGERQFAPGDRLIFLENDREIGVKNGMLASVLEASPGKLKVQIDLDGVADGKVLDITSARYANVDHGYAATVHKSQGATVDKVHVLATPGMDMHLAYVAMSRHRESVVLHAARPDFLSKKQQTGLEEKMANPLLAKEIDAQVFASLAYRLGRDGSKEVTLDYTDKQDYHVAAASIADRTSVSTLERLAKKLDRLEQREQLVADQVRAPAMRDLANHFADRRGLNSLSTLLPALREQTLRFLNQARHVLALGGRLDAAKNNLEQVQLEKVQAVAGGQADKLDRPLSASKAAQEQAVAPRVTSTSSRQAHSDEVQKPVLPALIPAFVMNATEKGVVEARILAQAKAAEPVQRQIASFHHDATGRFRKADDFTKAIIAALPLSRSDFVKRVGEIVADIERYGLKGEDTLFAGRAAKAERQVAVALSPQLVANALGLKDEIDSRSALMRKQELARYEKMNIAIPGVSPKAMTALQAIGSASREDREKVRAFVRGDPVLSAEINAVVKAVERRFGNGPIGETMEQFMPGGAKISPELRAAIHGAGMECRIQEVEQDREKRLALEQVKNKKLTL